MRCDFHTHSTVSDGSFTPSELIEEAQRERIDVLALTDHDDVSGVAEAQQRGIELGIEVIGGIEVSVADVDPERRMHILGLGIDPEFVPLLQSLAAATQQRANRARDIVTRLQEAGVDLEYEQVTTIAGPGSIGRPHIAKALVDSGVCADEDEAFGKYLRRGRPAYVEHPGMSARAAIEMIQAAGGVASLAHPPLSGGVDAPGGIEVFLERLVRVGLDGVEVHHPGHRSGTIKRLRRFARNFELIQTGGSDFHGASRPDVRLGRGRGGIRVGRPEYDQLRARLAQRRDNAGVLTPSGAATTLARPS